VTPADLLRRELQRDGARPLITWYDDNDGARVELSVATTANWAAKLAGLLTDEHDAEPGVVVSVRLPLHWQTACLLLAVWVCGAAVDPSGDADVVVGQGDDADISVPLDPMGVALSRLAGAQPDEFRPIVPVDPQAPALRLGEMTWSHTDLATAATAAAAHHSLDASARVLTTLPYDTADGLDAGLLVPLAAGASLVLVSDADGSLLPDRCLAEKVTHTAGVDVPDLPRLA
jgi:uncharacterized protein (TIGR03089 family)